MTTERSMVQRSTTRSIGYIHIAELGDQGFGTAHSLVGCSDVQWRLPVLIAGVYICRVFQQNLDSFLQTVTTLRCKYL